MQNILLHLDSSTRPSVFDRIVAFDGGANQVLSYGGVSPHEVRDLVHGALFTRGPADLRRTAVFVGGNELAAGERLCAAVLASFFGPFRVSVMLDSNGANTTAVAAVARVREALGSLQGVRAVVLAGSGPVGSRVAGLLAREGATVTVTSRRDHNGALGAAITRRFGATPLERVLLDSGDAAAVIHGADVVVSAGPPGTTLIPRTAWVGGLARVLVDLNAVPPAGIEGVEPADKATLRDNVIAYGALGVGTLKMKIHKACIATLFERNDLTLDAEGIVEVASGLRASRS